MSVDKILKYLKKGESSRLSRNVSDYLELTEDRRQEFVKEAREKEGRSYTTRTDYAVLIHKINTLTVIAERLANRALPEDLRDPCGYWEVGLTNRGACCDYKKGYNEVKLLANVLISREDLLEELNK